LVNQEDFSMQFKDITHNTQTLYRLQEQEEVLFFMLNRNGEITFELVGTGARAHILSLTLENTGEHSLSITQRHTGQATFSRLIGKTVASGNAACTSYGLVIIEKGATDSDASQEYRNLLLSDKASALSRPALEIKTDAVKAHHAATTSTLQEEALFFAESRGLERDEARKLLLMGFVSSLLDEIPDVFADEKRRLREDLETRVHHIIQ
jgi:Fe-S cluster assembly protein SufD